VFTLLCNLDCASYAWQFLSIIGVAPLKLHSNNNSLNTPTSQYLPPFALAPAPSCPPYQEFLDPPMLMPPVYHNW